MSNEISDSTSLPGAPHSYAWHVQGQSVNVVYDVAGAGPPILLLPAMGLASTRAEMWGLARQLQDRFETYTVDLPGFGAHAHPSIHWQPEHYRSFLSEFAADHFQNPAVVVAAGHTSTYALQVACDRPSAWSRIVMIGPTWRAERPAFPGVTGGLFRILQRLLEAPVPGEAFYRFRSGSAALERLYRTRLFADASKVTPRLIVEKKRVAAQQNARRAVAAYLTGSLDPVSDQEEYIDLVAHQLVPLIAVCGVQTPAGPWQDMLPLLQRPEVVVHRVPGALAPHQEHPAPVSRVIADFLGPLSD